jgi:hypothetical protein
MGAEALLMEEHRPKYVTDATQYAGRGHIGPRFNKWDFLPPLNWRADPGKMVPAYIHHPELPIRKRYLLYI